MRPLAFVHHWLAKIWQPLACTEQWHVTALATSVRIDRYTVGAAEDVDQAALALVVGVGLDTVGEPGVSLQCNLPIVASAAADKTKHFTQAMTSRREARKCIGWWGGGADHPHHEHVARLEQRGDRHGLEFHVCALE